jgi:hypothetical protein
VCTIPARSTVKFVHGLVYRFGVPNRIITDNGSQFTSVLFREYYTSIGIKIYLPLSPIPGAMARLSVPTPKSSRDLRREASTPSSKPVARNG